MVVYFGQWFEQPHPVYPWPSASTPDLDDLSATTVLRFCNFATNVLVAAARSIRSGIRKPPTRITRRRWVCSVITQPFFTVGNNVVERGCVDSAGDFGPRTSTIFAGIALWHGAGLDDLDAGQGGHLP